MENLVGGEAPVRVRLADGADVDCLWRICRNQTLEEFRLWGADLAYTYPPSLAQMEERLADSRDTLLFAVEKDRKVIGFAELTELDRERGHAVLARVILEPGQRGRGSGPAAIRQIADYAGGVLGLREIRLVVYQENRRAMRCYEACGFVCTGPLLRPGRPPAWNMKMDVGVEDEFNT